MNCRRNGTKSSRRSWDTGARSFDLLEFPRRPHLLGERKAVFHVDHLTSAGDFPQPVFGGVIANRDIAAGFKAVSDDAPIFAFEQKIGKAALGMGLDTGQGNSVGIAEPIEYVGELGILR